MLNILKRPKYRTLIRRFFVVIYIVALGTLLILKSGNPSPIFRDFPALDEGTTQIGFLETASDDSYMLYSAQYYLAPILVVHTDPYCCHYLITNDVENLNANYTTLIEFFEGWYLAELAE